MSTRLLDVTTQVSDAPEKLEILTVEEKETVSIPIIDTRTTEEKNGINTSPHEGKTLEGKSLEVQHGHEGKSQETKTTATEEEGGAVWFAQWALVGSIVLTGIILCITSIIILVRQLHFDEHSAKDNCKSYIAAAILQSLFGYVGAGYAYIGLTYFTLFQSVIFAYIVIWSAAFFIPFVGRCGWPFNEARTHSSIRDVTMLCYVSVLWWYISAVLFAVKFYSGSEGNELC